ncbi:hypothetical protein AB1Y20_020280 [Prymnesium parvum]|uniref:Cation/H+ exchanger transmembrane domain-containing protein n=1 Tax=Prymnesium parvum TaxID=97485 RepID=A0AB34JXI6_PRYPA
MVLDEEAHSRALGKEYALAAGFLLVLLLVAISAEKRHFPSSAAVIALGAAAGALLWRGGMAAACGLERLASLDADTFYFLLLPPVIFEAGFSLHKRPFFRHLATILLFALLGTMLTLLAVGAPLYTMGRAGAFRDAQTGSDALDFRTPLDAYLFGALISATDPVATLSIMGAVGVDEQLYALIFGESVLNDAVAVVLVGILHDLGDDGFAHPLHFLRGLGRFAFVASGSIAIAVAVAAPSALLLKRLRAELRHHASFEVGLILIFGYASYALADAAGCSGILSLFLSGLLESHYHVYSLSEGGRHATAIALKSLAHLFETVIFAYMGLDIFADTPAAAPPHAALCANSTQYDTTTCLPTVARGAPVLALTAAAVALVVASRAVVVPPLCLVANWLWVPRRMRIQPSACVAIVAAGLRGAIAFALAKSVSSYHRANIAAATTGVVVFTTFVLGGLTRPLLVRLGLVPRADRNVREEIKARDDKAREEAEAEGRRRAAESGGALLPGSRARVRRLLRRLGSRLRRLDVEVLQPMFIAKEALDPPPPLAQPPPPADALVDEAVASEIELTPLGHSAHQMDSALRVFEVGRLPRARVTPAHVEATEA